MNRWVSSMETMLASLNDHRVKTSSISNVPEQLRETRKEAYMPEVVSIGPLHRQTALTRRELLYMEEIKWRCMSFLLSRTPTVKGSLKKCRKAIYKLDKVVRAAYTDHIKLNGYDLAKIMLLDGCFLLELLISNDKVLDRKLRNDPNQEEESPGAEVVKNELVLSDLKLLENQIPFFILTVLFQTLFDTEALFKTLFGNEALFETPFDTDAQINHAKARKIVNNSALSLFVFGTRVDDGSSKSMITRVDDGSSSSKSMITHVDDGSSSSKSITLVDDPNCAHFLGLVHWFMTREVENNHHVSRTVDGNGSTEPKQTLELKHCAARLEAVGVTIAPLDSDPEKEGSNNMSLSIRVENGEEVIPFGCDIEFIHPPHNTETTSKGSNKNPEIHPLLSPQHSTETTSKGSNKKLKIHPLHITETTEVQWRNLIAWEQNRIAHERFHKVENPTRCKFSQYALLFKDLVCCEHDIQLLKSGEVQVLKVDNGEKRSNKDLMTLFQEMAKGIDVDLSMDESYRQLLEGLNKCSGTKWNCKILSHHWESFKAKTRYMCRDLLEILKREYTPNMWKTLGVIAAIILLVLTVAQTIFAAISL